MRSPESFITHQSPEQTLLDTDPAVRMDIAFGDKLTPGQVIEVDYAALRESLHYVGAPSDSSDLSITYVPAGVNNPTGSKGQYHPTKNQLYVWLPQTKRGLKQGQKSLQHELKHYADRERILGTPEMADAVYDVSYRHANKVAAAAAGVISLGIANNLYRYVAYDIPEAIEPISASFSSNTPGIVLAGFGASLLAALPYRLDSSERRAHRAERGNLKQVVTIHGSAR